MGVRFVLRADKQFNKGFTFLEMMVVLMVISALSLLFVLPVVFADELGVDSIIEAQLKAMADSERVVIQEGLWFNIRGNINQAQTVNYKGFKCVFQLGFGRFTCG